MSETTVNKNHQKIWWLLTLAAIFFVLLFATAGFMITFDNMFQNRIYPNIFIGNLNLSGQTAEQARRLINQEIDKINQGGIIFSYKNSPITINPVIASADADLAYQIISFNSDRTITMALSYGKNHNPFINLKNKLKN